MKKIIAILLISLITACDQEKQTIDTERFVSDLDDEGATKLIISEQVLKNPVEDLFEHSWVGVIMPNNSVDVLANTNGLLSISARVGDLIKQGDVLARVDSFTAQDDLEVEKLKLKALQAELEQAEFNAKQERSLYERRIAHPDAISKDELDRSESSSRAAEANWKATQSNVEEQVIRVEQYKKGILSQAVGSPFSGTVVMHYLDSGSVINAGTPIMRVSTSNAFMVRFAIEPHQAGVLAIGDQVQLSVNNDIVPAEVMSIAPFVDIPSQKIFVEAFPLEQHELLRTGLGVEVVPVRSFAAQIIN